jgi:hypothetical protein
MWKHPARGGITDIQVNGKWLGNNDEEESELEDKCNDKYCYQVIRGPKTITPQRDEKTGTKKVTKKRRWATKVEEKFILSHKDVERFCRGLREHGESKDNLPLPPWRGGKGGRSKKRKKRHVVGSDTSSSDSD